MSKNKKNIHTSVVTISPSTAAKWLTSHDKATHKRIVSDSKVKQYADDMKAGAWPLTHQGIAFNADGRLIDGQHRLHAIVLANTPVKMLLTTNVPVDDNETLKVEEVIDQGRGRSLFDQVTIMGASKTTSAAVAKVTVAMYNGNSAKKRFAFRGKLAFFKKYVDAMTWAVTQLPETKAKLAVRGITRAGVRACIARAYVNANGSTQKISKIKDFCDILKTGSFQGSVEEVVIRLRDFLLTTQSYAGSQASVEVYSKTSRALNYFLNDEVAKKMDARMTNENFFPLPEDEIVIVQKA